MPLPFSVCKYIFMCAMRLMELKKKKKSVNQSESLKLLYKLRNLLLVFHLMIAIPDRAPRRGPA